MLFDSTLRQDLSRSFYATLLVLVTIVLTMMLIRTLGQAAGGQVAPQDVILLMGYTVLGYLPTLLTLSLFIGVVMTLGRMYRDSEMAVWFASGVSLWRFLRPIGRMSFAVLLGVAVLVLGVWPWVNQRTELLKAQFEQRSDLSRVAPGQFQTSRDGSRVFFMERDDQNSRVGRQIFIVTQQGQTEAVTTAKSGRIESNSEQSVLILERGQRNEQSGEQSREQSRESSQAQRAPQTQSASVDQGDKTLASFEEQRVVLQNRSPQQAQTLPAKARHTLDLLREPTALHQGELAWRVGLILGTFNLTLLAVGLSATQPRRASNWNLLLALLSFVVYYNVINLAQAWVAGGRWSLFSALVLTHGSVLMGAVFLLWWRQTTHASWRGWFSR
jgi:lipopolysaccharide export system permease protein